MSKLNLIPQYKSIHRVTAVHHSKSRTLIPLYYDIGLHSHTSQVNSQSLMQHRRQLRHTHFAIHIAAIAPKLVRYVNTQTTTTCEWRRAFGRILIQITDNTVRWASNNVPWAKPLVACILQHPVIQCGLNHYIGGVVVLLGKWVAFIDRWFLPVKEELSPRDHGHTIIWRAPRQPCYVIYRTIDQKLGLVFTVLRTLEVTIYRRKINRELLLWIKWYSSDNKIAIGKYFKQSWQRSITSYYRCLGQLVRLLRLSNSTFGIPDTRSKIFRVPGSHISRK